MLEMCLPKSFAGWLILVEIDNCGILKSMHQTFLALQPISVRNRADDGQYPQAQGTKFS